MKKKDFLQQVLANNPNLDVELLDRAFSFAVKAHEGQWRKSGEAYVEHPINTALTISHFMADSPTLVAALLHDVPEDTSYTLDYIRKEFGKEIAFLVDGVTKLGKIQYRGVERYSENLRKMFVAMAKDIRVIIIRLADRLHNLKTLEFLPLEKRQRVAAESLEIYAPIANRLGMGELKGQIEDMAFKYVYPKEYEALSQRVANYYKEYHHYIKRAKKILERRLKKEGIHVLSVTGRAKHLYSLHLKLKRYDNDLTKIYDLVALRVIVITVPECYQALGLIHNIWTPLLGRIKDYIAQPKPNGYQSLHTTVYCLNGRKVEIQVRTPQMHQEAEFGIAAHWHYTESGKPEKTSKINPVRTQWISNLLTWQKEIADGQQYLEALKIDAFTDRLFVFTPKGDVIDLPEGSTPVDFAYAIHSDLGQQCSQVKINDKIASLDTNLKNGDSVEIITDRRRPGPARDWLDFVQTNLAKNRIRAWLNKNNRQELVVLGTKLLNQELKKIKKSNISEIPRTTIKKLLQTTRYTQLEDLLAALAQGNLTPQAIITQLFTPEEILSGLPRRKNQPLGASIRPASHVLVENNPDFLTTIAKCCYPFPGEPIIGLVVKNKGVSIHRRNCSHLHKSDKRRWLSARWAQRKASSGYEVVLEITSQDRIGLLRDITNCFANNNINILSIFTKPPRQTTEKIMTVRIKTTILSLEKLLHLIKALEQIDSVRSVSRI